MSIWKPQQFASNSRGICFPTTQNKTTQAIDYASPAQTHSALSSCLAVPPCMRMPTPSLRTTQASTSAWCVVPPPPDKSCLSLLFLAESRLCLVLVASTAEFCLSLHLLHKGAACPWRVHWAHLQITDLKAQAGASLLWLPKESEDHITPQASTLACPDSQAEKLCEMIILHWRVGRIP